jgi:hypothetical protein
MIEIAGTTEATPIDIGEKGIKISREIKTKRGRRNQNPLKYPCPSKYPCPLFLEKDANEKGQDRRSTTIEGTRPIMRENFGILFLGYQN